MLDWKKWHNGILKAEHNGKLIYISETSMGHMYDGIDFVGPDSLEQAKNHAEFMAAS